ncbi:hypothetical protein E4T38_04743 [Aureobasidium subglaciale]|nr:hypothetical protein E4T38_04743 [Aureobasidium subglaciale]KAI5223143.1 hypothetical protein E4T40_04660 [Aureobasidium subglaciale]KAI5226796.1 hypothetical protein E4T41_04603 [Aureobasidium subglaciale]
MSGKNSQVPPVRYKLSQSPGERAKLILVNEVSGLGPRPLFKEVARGRGVVRGHRQERSDVLPLRDVENLRPTLVSHEKQRSLSSNPGRQRSMVAQEMYSRPRDARSAETLQPAVLQAISYESPRKTSIGDPSERLGDRIMARKNSRDETPVMMRKSSRDESFSTVRKGSRDDTSSMRKGSRDEAAASSRSQVADDTPEPLRHTPRLQLTTVPEVRDESIMERGRPVSRRDSKRGHSTDPFSGNLSPRSHSAAPNYTLPQTCYAPSEPSVQPSPSKSSGPKRPLLHSSVSTPCVPRLPSIQQSLSAPNTARPTFHSTHSTPSTSTRPSLQSLQSSLWIPEHPRKDSLDPIAFRTDPAFRILRALRKIDKSCLRLFDDCEALQQERSTLHTEMMSVISKKDFNSAHLEIIRQQQQDLVDLDAKIDVCTHSIMERQRRKTKLVDGLPEVQEMDKAEELKQRLAAREAEAGGMGTPVRAASPWGPRESSLKTSVQVNGLLSPPPTSKTQQRGTVTYSAIMDFLDEFD